MNSTELLTCAARVVYHAGRRCDGQQVFAAALEKARGEKRVKKAIQEGMSAVEVWRKYGIT